MASKLYFYRPQGMAPFGTLGFYQEVKGSYKEVSVECGMLFRVSARFEVSGSRIRQIKSSSSLQGWGGAVGKRLRINQAIVVASGSQFTDCKREAKDLGVELVGDND